MTVSLPAALALRDLLDCMGWGLLLALVYDLARLAVGSGFWRCLVLDLLGFALGAVVLRGYAAALSAAGAPRSYHLAGLALGAASWFWVVGPQLEWVRRGVARLASLPGKWAANHLLAPIKKGFCRKREKNLKKSAELPQKQLPKKGKVLYNSK